MLELRKVTKIYKSNALSQRALDSVSLSFRENEFTSILGPSGSGKTTLLNIIGGLDSYTSGDLIIDKISTKKYKDSDWDSYRNHRIGFVFQSYNLISHQSILNNVKLALTLSGISKKESISRAKKALKDVGLSDHIYKRPAQLSGGQMQRVAIARALVNDPDIILADEPTGALDSETSIQIMEILKQVSKSKLVIMVTHNPELAKKYSSRIINIKDGKILSDSNPYKNLSEKKTPNSSQSKSKKTKMNFLTAIKLSFNNLMTKKGRTALVSFAGSIGIIGIALISAVSTGFQNYVDSIQEDTLNSYPLMITEESFSIGSLITTEEDIENNKEKNYVGLREDAKKDLVEYPVMTNMLKSIATNDLKSFKKYYDKNSASLKNDIKSLTVGYDIRPLIYSVDKTKKVAKLNPNDTFDSMFGSSMSMLTNFTGGSTSIYSPFYSSDREIIESKYDLLAGRLPEKYNELVINPGVKGTISDLLAYELGLKDTSELNVLVKKLMSSEPVNLEADPILINYEDLLNLDLRLILPSDLYRYNEKYNVYEDMSSDEAFVKNVYETKAIKLKVVGIITKKDGVTTEALEQGVNYPTSLIDFIIEQSAKSAVVKNQLENPEINVLSGNRFDEDKTSFDYSFEDLVKVDEEKLSSMFDIKIDQSALSRKIEEYMTEISNSIDINQAPAADALVSAFDSLTKNLAEKLEKHEKANPETPLTTEDIDAFVEEFIYEYESGKIFAKLEKEYVLPADVYRELFAGLLKSLLPSYLEVKKFNVPLETIVEGVKSSAAFESAKSELSKTMTEAKIKKSVLEKVGELSSYLSDSFAKSFNIDTSALTSAFTLNFSEDELTRIMESLLNKSDSTLKSNLSLLGYQDPSDPSYLYFYFTSFDGKENFLNFIEDYNEKVEKEQKINYSDMTGLLMNSVKVIINAVSYVLIAFVSISLVVSSIMIGIITYISVYERTKEIGILRAMGASKHNISSIFNAETFIIGFLSGLFGIMISYIFIPIINAVLNHYTNVANLRAALNPSSALLLILLSIALTLIGGLIPARSASKKDPVEALRTE